MEDREMNSVLKQAIIDAICEGMGDEARPWDASNVSPGWLRQYIQHEVDVITEGDWFAELIDRAVARRLEK